MRFDVAIGFGNCAGPPDIKDAQLRGQLDLDALRELSVTVSRQVVARSSGPPGIGAGRLWRPGTRRGRRRRVPRSQYLAHLLGEAVRGKGLRKERAAGFRAGSRLQHFVLSLNQGKARHVEHLQPGPLGLEPCCELVKATEVPVGARRPAFSGILALNERRPVEAARTPRAVARVKGPDAGKPTDRFEEGATCGAGK